MENLPSYDYPNIGPLFGGSPKRAIPVMLLTQTLELKGWLSAVYCLI